jgi:uncharacterized membrane protein
MLILCPQCSAQMPLDAAFCPRCGFRMIAAPATATATRGFLPENVAAALAYLTPIPAIVFLRLKGFQRNHFVRFHSFQSIFLTIGSIVLAVAVRILFWMLSLIPRLGYLAGSLAVLLCGLGLLILWCVVVVKALQHELFKVPVIGNLAEGA